MKAQKDSVKDQGHISNIWQSQDSKPGSSAPKSMLLTTMFSQDNFFLKKNLLLGHLNSKVTYILYNN